MTNSPIPSPEKFPQWYQEGKAKVANLRDTVTTQGPLVIDSIKRQTTDFMNQLGDSQSRNSLINSALVSAKESWRKKDHRSVMLLMVVMAIFCISGTNQVLPDTSVYVAEKSRIIDMEVSRSLLHPTGRKRAVRQRSVPRPKLPLEQRKNSSIVYIHVGRTGGTSLDRVLRSNCEWYQSPGPRHDCFKALNAMEAKLAENQKKNPRRNSVNVISNTTSTMISKHTKATLHVGLRGNIETQIEKSNMFLLSARNPITRAVSAFNADHPFNHVNQFGKDQKMPGSFRKLYMDCFLSMEDYAQLLYRYSHIAAAKSSFASLTEQEQECLDRGIATLKGDGSKYAGVHLAYNYRYYGKHSFLEYPEKPLLVLRTEHLWEDVYNLETFMSGDINAGGNEVFLHTLGWVKETLGSDAFVVKSGLSEDGERRLCCYLEAENQIYDDIIRRAINLLPSEKEETLRVLYKQCGIDARAALRGSQFSWGAWANQTCVLPP